MERYKQDFPSSDPYEQTVEENWSNFKETVIMVIDTNNEDIPWLNNYYEI